MSLAIFFLDLGLGEVLCLGTPGTCLRREQALDFFRLDSPAEGASALARAHLIKCTHGERITRDTLVIARSAPQPPQGSDRFARCHV